MPRAGAGPRSPLTLRSALSCLGLQGRGGQEAPPRPSGWAGAAPTRSRASTVVSGRQLGRAAGGMGTAGGAGPPQTNVAWCGLALGLAGPPGAGLRLGRSDAGDLLACGLRGPVRTPETLRPSLGAEPATRSTSMIVLTGRPRLLWAPPPGLGGPAESCGVGGGGNKVLLGLLMSPSPVSVRSATCSPSTVWTPPASDSCAWGVAVLGVVGVRKGGLSAEPGLVPGLSGWSRAGPQGSRGRGSRSWPAAAVLPGRPSSMGLGGRRRNSGSTRSSFLSSPRWSSALLL